MPSAPILSAVKSYSCLPSSLIGAVVQSIPDLVPHWWEHWFAPFPLMDLVVRKMGRSGLVERWDSLRIAKANREKNRPVFILM